MRLLFAIIALAGAPAFAQASDIPRTQDGRPDFHGFWATEFMTPLERPDPLRELVVPPSEVDAALKIMTPDKGELYDPEIDFNPFPANLLEMDGAFRSSMIVEPADGKLPLTALAKAQLAHLKPAFDNPEERPGAERCVDSMNHPPFQIATWLIPHQIVQTPDAMVITTEDLDAGRIVPFTGAPPGDDVRSRAGYSRGSWDGDTLVVVTDHIAIADHRGFLFRGEALITADSRIVERFRLRSSDEILYQFTIEDPALYKAPWRAEYLLRRTVRPVYEYACHEGNHATYGILGAARMGRQEPAPPPPKQ